LSAALPDKITYTYNDFGFDATEHKQEFMLNLKGFYTNIPLDGIENVKIGDRIPNPEYKSEMLVVYGKDKNYVYAYLEHTLNHILTDRKRMYTDEYKPIAEFIKTYVKEFEPNERHISTDTIYAFEYVLLNGVKSYYASVDPPKEKVAEFQDQYSAYKQAITAKVIAKYSQKFNITTTINPVGDTWRFYENPTVSNTIKELGYGGYVAVEKNHNTYLIFQPDVHVEIIDRKRV
jgi:hypothetical protein